MFQLKITANYNNVMLPKFRYKICDKIKSGIQNKDLIAWGN